MCGGFVIAYSSAKISPKDDPFVQFVCHFNYNLGRISSYVILGFIVGFIGGAISYSRVVNGYIYFVVGVVMVLMGLSLMGKIKFLSTFESSLALHPKFRQAFSFLMRSKSKLSFYFLGLLNGFIPCGLVYFFLASALASGSALNGAFVMLIFGISTIPSLMGFGYVLGFLKSTSFRDVMIKLASFVIICYGIYLSYVGFLATQS